MPRKLLSIEQKQENARDRQRRRAERIELLKEKARLKFQAKVAKIRAKQAEEQAFLKAEVERLSEMAGEAVRQFSYPTPDQRAAVVDFRERNDWSIRKMARVCGCETRHIRMIESEDRSVYMLKKTFDRILLAVHWKGTGLPTVTTAGLPVDDDPVVRRLRAEMANVLVHSHPVDVECGADCSARTGVAVTMAPRPPINPKRETGPRPDAVTRALIAASQNEIIHNHAREISCTEMCGAFGKTPRPTPPPPPVQDSRSRSRSGSRDDITAALREESRRMITHSHPFAIPCAAGCPGWVAPPVTEITPPIETETVESEPESEWLTF